MLTTHPGHRFGAVPTTPSSWEPAVDRADAMGRRAIRGAAAIRARIDARRLAFEGRRADNPAKGAAVATPVRHAHIGDFVNSGGFFIS
ncbi:MAG: hypothetical protein ACR2P0_16220 [Acidimicrobiales bacterium]